MNALKCGVRVGITVLCVESVICGMRADAVKPRCEHRGLGLIWESTDHGIDPFFSRDSEVAIWGQRAALVQALVHTHTLSLWKTPPAVCVELWAQLSPHIWPSLLPPCQTRTELLFGANLDSNLDQSFWIQKPLDSCYIAALRSPKPPLAFRSCLMRGHIDQFMWIRGAAGQVNGDWLGPLMLGDASKHFSRPGVCWEFRRSICCFALLQHSEEMGACFWRGSSLVSVRVWGTGCEVLVTPAGIPP